MPPLFRMVGPLMCLEALDAAGAPSAFVIGFRLTDAGGELWTSRFNALKAGEPGAVASGARAMAVGFGNITFPGVDRVVVVGAISSADATLGAAAPVRAIGEAIATAKNWEWRPELLSKEIHRSLHGLTGAGSRDAEVQGKYRCDAIPGTGPGLVLIVDDFCTRGATFAEIGRAVRSANAGWTTWGAAIGKTEHSAFWNGDITNAHIPPELERAWTGG